MVKVVEFYLSAYELGLDSQGRIADIALKNYFQQFYEEIVDIGYNLFMIWVANAKLINKYLNFSIDKIFLYNFMKNLFMFCLESFSHYIKYRPIKSL